ncbi:MAG: YIP1 family protein [Cytophagaceae bacterium]|jgi:hypothetical protein|nr:YIP1 family protein [Cytophagaceae bacterium]
MEKKDELIKSGYKQVFIRLINIIIKPVSEWKKISAENRDMNEIMTDYSLVLTALCTLVKFVSILVSVQELNYMLAMKNAVIVFLFLFGSLYLTYFFMRFAMTRMKLATSNSVVFGLTAYSFTPFYVATIVVNLIPELFFVYLLVLYGLYIAFIGVNEFFIVKGERAVYISIIMICVMVATSYLIHFIFFKLMLFWLE